MANIEFKTEGVQNPQGKPRVYFTCHPMDFNRVFQDASKTCFEIICNYIFRITDCAIYYTPDMSETLDAEDVEKLGLMKLFVIPVTTRLLSTPNRTMNVDIVFAKEHNIRILPILMEPISDDLYSDEKNFGKHQYINPFSTDPSEVDYFQKLTRYVKETLVDEITTKKIKNAFDSYIFLSYRKMDRKLANELMKKIHNMDGYYDIAIWYDEFLVPGEQWDENIKSAMNMVNSQSKLFILLVTPNITQKVVRDGKEYNNYVVENEYPNAKNISMNILPAEIQNTDHKELEVFYDIPPCINVHTEDFVAVMKEILKNIENKNNEESPEHLYYIGLAYLNGIDIEVDVERGLKLITRAAEGDNCDAIEKLIYVYRYGSGTKQNLGEALRWAKRLTELYEVRCEADDEKIIAARETLADIHYERGDITKALQIYETLLNLMFNKYGPDDPKTIVIYRKLATVCIDLEDYQKAIGMLRMAYSIQHMNQQEETPESIATFFEYAKAHLKTEHFLEAYTYLSEAYTMYVKTYTENDYRTLSVKEYLAMAYNYNGLFSEAIEMQKNVCDQLCEKYGNDNTATIKAYMNLSRLYSEQGKHDDAIRLATDMCNMTCDLFGEGNSMSLECIALLAEVYRGAGHFDVSVNQYDRLYTLQQKYLEPNHMKTLQERTNLGITYVMMGGKNNLRHAIEVFNEVFDIQKNVLSAFELKTVKTKYLIANCYSLLGNNSRAIKLQKEVVNTMRHYYKANHIYTMRYVHYLGCYYYLRYCEMMETRYLYTNDEMFHMLLSAEQYMKEAYATSSRIYAEDDARNLRIMGDIEIVLNEKKRFCL